MADDGPSNQKSDARFDHIRERIASGFPKLAGPKLDKLLLTHEIREIIVHFCDDDQKRCLVVPESMKIDLDIPSGPFNCKVLLFVKLQHCTLTMENIHSVLLERTFNSLNSVTVEEVIESVHGVPFQVILGGSDEVEVDMDKIELIASNIPAGVPIAIVSVVGAIRSGRSFLVNAARQYLHFRDRDHWLTDGLILGYAESRGRNKNGFPWRGGTETETRGAWMWSTPYLTTNSAGETIAVLLLDTQGMFGSSAQSGYISQIFALATLISSNVIMNVQNLLREHDIQEAAQFVSLLQEVTDKKLHRLTFLVRDWTEYTGEEDDEDFTNKCYDEMSTYFQQLLALQGASGQTQARKHLKAFCNNIDGFCLPHPGLLVTKKRYAGETTHLDRSYSILIDEFMRGTFITNLIPSCSPEGVPLFKDKLAETFSTAVDLVRTMPEAVGIAQAAELLSANAQAKLDAQSTVYNLDALAAKHEHMLGVIKSAFVISITIVGALGLVKGGVREYFVNLIKPIVPLGEVRWNRARDKIRIIVINQDKATRDQLTKYLAGMSKNHDNSHSFTFEVILNETISEITSDSCFKGKNVADSLQVYSTGKPTPDKQRRLARGKWHCDRCSTTVEEMRYCAICTKRLYCSRTCQIRDWHSGHKIVCPVIVQRRLITAAELDAVAELEAAAKLEATISADTDIVPSLVGEMDEVADDAPSKDVGATAEKQTEK